MLGQLPSGYSKAIHGPYDPAIFYGKADMPLSQVKVYQLPAWLLRKQFYNPIAYGRSVSRAYWRWNHKYALPKYSGLTPLLQMTVGLCGVFYLMNYTKIAHHANAKYHW
eukprot:TRINITY_DN3257_c0_g1_i1.p1 TRINITY_DN3257_c0_g1~~TRINITY_DN3257_c0_g1_i1.p1  ORF type:complete len:109 (-),score=10.50 TRINITY_DN3257_c0_g1_i1:101-427(-)